MKSENNDDNKNAESRVQVSAGGARRTASRQKNAGSRTRQYRGGGKNRRISLSGQQQKKTDSRWRCKKQQKHTETGKDQRQAIRSEKRPQSNIQT